MNILPENSCLFKITVCLCKILRRCFFFINSYVCLFDEKFGLLTMYKYLLLLLCLVCGRGLCGGDRHRRVEQHEHVGLLQGQTEADWCPVEQ